jgi:hypothetical protein
MLSDGGWQLLLGLFLNSTDYENLNDSMIMEDELRGQ